MAVTPVQRNATINNSGVSSNTVAKPSGIQNGDLLILFVSSNNGFPTSVTGGWTLLDQVTRDDINGSLWWKWVTDTTAEPASYVVNFSVGDASSAGIQSYRNVEQSSNPFEDLGGGVYVTFSDNAVGLSHTHPGITTSGKRRKLIGGAFKDTSGGWSGQTSVDGSTWSEQGIDTGTTLGNDAGLVMADAPKDDAGSTGTFTQTASGSMASTTFMFALKPIRAAFNRNVGQSNAGTAASITVTKPSSMEDGDMLLAFCASKDAEFEIGDLSNGPWTHVVTYNLEARLYLSFFYKFITNAAGEPASYTITRPGPTDVYAAHLSTWDDVDPDDPIGQMVGAGNLSPTTGGPGFDTPLSEQTLVGGAVFNDDGGFTSGPNTTIPSSAEWTTNTAINSTAGTDISGRIQQAVKAVVGVTGDVTYASVAVNQDNVYALVEINSEDRPVVGPMLAMVI